MPRADGSSADSRGARSPRRAGAATRPAPDPVGHRRAAHARRRLRRDLLLDLQADGHRAVPLREGADQAALPRSAPAQPVPGRPGEVHRLRAVRLGLPGRRDLRRGRRQHARRAVLARRALRPRLPDQLPALHLLRAVHRGLPDAGADDDERLRARRPLACGDDLREAGPAGARWPTACSPPRTPWCPGTEDTDYYRGEVTGPVPEQVDWVAQWRPEDPSLPAASAAAAR